MANERTLRVTILGDASSVTRAMQQVEGGAARLNGALSGTAKIAGGFLAANVIAGGVGQLEGFFTGAKGAASGLAESMNAVNVVFGDSAAKINEFGKTSAEQIGLSQRAFNELATPLGAMLKNAGLGMDEVSGKTIDLASRAADMASVFNTDVEDALAAIQAGLRGEADPLERFGVGLSAAKVEAKAMAETGKAVASALTDEEKALARINLIMEQTEAVRGDFANTSDGLANKERINAARQEETAAKIGEKLMPVYLALSEVKLKLATVIADQVVPAIERLSVWANEHLVPAMEQLGRFLRDDVAPNAQKVGEAFTQHVLPPLQSFGQWLMDHKDVLVAVGVAWATFTFTTQTFAAIQGVQALFAAMSTGIKAVNLSLLAPPGIAILLAGIAAAIFLIWQNWDEIWPRLQAGFEAFKGAASGVWNAVSGFFTGLASDIGRILGGVRDTIEERWSEAVSILRGLPGRLISLAGDFLQIGRNLIGGLIEGIKARAGDLVNAIKTWVTDKIPQFVKDALGIRSPSTVFAGIGEEMMSGLALGIRQGTPLPIEALQELLQRVRETAAGGLTGLIGGNAGFGAGIANAGGFTHTNLDGSVVWVSTDPSRPARGGAPSVSLADFNSQGGVFGPQVVQNISVTVEDRSPAAIRNAAVMAGEELASQLDLTGVR